MADRSSGEQRVWMYFEKAVTKEARKTAAAQAIMILSGGVALWFHHKAPGERTPP